MAEETEPGRLIYAGEIRRFVLGGHATFTCVSAATGERVTYQVKSAKKDKEQNWSTGNQDRSLYFVSVLTGPSNESDFQYMGLLTRNEIGGEYAFRTTAKSRIGRDSKAYKVFHKLWNAIELACTVPAWLEFWHEGRCCACGRKLTVPESVASGIGPECASKGA